MQNGLLRLFAYNNLHPGILPALFLLVICFLLAFRHDNFQGHFVGCLLVLFCIDGGSNLCLTPLRVHVKGEDGSCTLGTVYEWFCRCTASLVAVNQNGYGSWLAVLFLAVPHALLFAFRGTNHHVAEGGGSLFAQIEEVEQGTHQ